MAKGHEPILPFATAKIRYFDRSKIDEAREWAEAA
jgi:hypothetical protein